MCEQLCFRLSFIIAKKFAATEVPGSGRRAGFAARGVRVDNGAIYNADDWKCLPVKPDKLWEAGCSATHSQHGRSQVLAKLNSN